MSHLPQTHYGINARTLHIRSKCVYLKTVFLYTTFKQCYVSVKIRFFKSNVDDFFSVNPKIVQATTRSVSNKPLINNVNTFLFFKLYITSKARMCLCIWIFYKVKNSIINAYGMLALNIPVNEWPYVRAETILTNQTSDGGNSNDTELICTFDQYYI